MPARQYLVRLLTCSLLASVLLPTTAHAAPAARLQVTFAPYQLGQSTNVTFHLQLAGTRRQVPPPLTEVNLKYPSNLGLAISGLGLVTCTRPTLEALGPQGCPPDSHMGQGTAIAEISAQSEIIRETADVQIVRAPEEQGHIAILFNVYGWTPVNAEVIFAGVLLPASAADENIDIQVPLVEGLPGGPDVAVTHSTRPSGHAASSTTNTTTANSSPTPPKASSCHATARAADSASPPTSPSSTAARQSHEQQSPAPLAKRGAATLVYARRFDLMELKQSTRSPAEQSTRSPWT